MKAIEYAGNALYYTAGKGYVLTKDDGTGISVVVSDEPGTYTQLAIISRDGIEYVDDEEEGNRKLRMFYPDEVEAGTAYVAHRLVTAGAWRKGVPDGDDH